MLDCDGDALHGEEGGGRGEGDYRCNILVVMPSLSTEVPVLGIVTGGEGARGKMAARPAPRHSAVSVARSPQGDPESAEAAKSAF